MSINNIVGNNHNEFQVLIEDPVEASFVQRPHDSPERRPSQEAHYSFGRHVAILGSRYRSPILHLCSLSILIGAVMAAGGVARSWEGLHRGGEPGFTVFGGIFLAGVLCACNCALNCVENASYRDAPPINRNRINVSSRITNIPPVLPVEENPIVRSVQFLSVAEWNAIRETRNCCGICLEEFSEKAVDLPENDNNPSIVKTECGHLLHKQCIDKNYQVNSTTSCPMCRDPQGKQTETALQITPDPLS